ncbi:hypothetical protein GGD50_005836 [Rhizobium paranaense]|uniref:Uncharacterized protein n=1 Tax=Rhizobium paranaense TaxID=1650438 RepID=A0A7W8XXI2_9HYPH|nr:hypothetical protein [Rhizobium paranaense]
MNTTEAITVVAFPILLDGLVGLKLRQPCPLEATTPIN